jgi:hypothetical protein
MPPCDYLDEETLNDLIPRLARLPLFEDEEPRSRRGYLELLGLKHLADEVGTSGPPRQYFNKLYPNLVRERTSTGDRQPALIALLQKVINDGEYKEDDDRERFEDTIARYRRWQVQLGHDGAPDRALPLGSAHTRQSADELAARRRASSAARPRKRRYKIDADAVLIEFDLREQLAFLTTHLPDEGLFVISTAGERMMVQSYVLKRIFQYLKLEHKREIEEHEVVLFNNDLVGVEVTEVVYCLIQRYLASPRLADLLGSPPVDIFLTIWNQDVPLSVLEQVALGFLGRARREIEKEIQKTSRIFIILWANVVEPPLKAVPGLPRYDAVTTENVLIWFRRCLSLAKVAPEDIELSLTKLKDRLERNRGAPPGIYQAMRSVISELREGRL